MLSPHVKEEKDHFYGAQFKIQDCDSMEGTLVQMAPVYLPSVPLMLSTVYSVFWEALAYFSKTMPNQLQQHDSVVTESWRFCAL